MPVQKLSDTQRPSAQRTAAVQKVATSKLVAAAKQRAETIASLDATANKLSKAFNSNRQFTADQVKKVRASLDVMAAQLATEAKASLGHLNTALRLNIATGKIVAQAEDIAALQGKVAILRQVAASTLAGDDEGDDLVQIDDSGYVVDDSTDVLDELPVSPETTASKKKADGSGVNLTEESFDGEPVGVPEEETPATRAFEPETKAQPRGTQPETNVNLTEAKKQKTSEGIDGEPVGVPQEDGQGGAESPSYSKEDPSTSAPDTTLAKKRKAAGNDGDPNYADVEPAGPETTVKTSKRTKADENGFDPANGQDLEKDTVSAEEDDVVVDPTVDPTLDADPVDDSELDIPVEDGLGDEEFDDLAADEDNGLDLELPESGFDDILQDEILAGDEFLDGDDLADPEVAPQTDELVASARTARRMTASRSSGSTPAKEADVLKAIVDSDFR